MKPYTFRDWLKAHKGQQFIWWQSYRDIYPWWTFWKTYKWQGWSADLWYYWRCRLWTKFNRIDIKTLPPTWHDADERMLHACFHILVDVIENERIFENTAAEGDRNDGRSWAWALKEMDELYGWWIFYRQQRHEESERLSSEWHKLWQRDLYAFRDNNKHFWQARRAESPTGTVLWEGSVPLDDSWKSEELLAADAAYKALDDSALDAEDEAMLIRLMKIRGYLWT